MASNAYREARADSLFPILAQGDETLRVIQELHTSGTYVYASEYNLTSQEFSTLFNQ